MALVLSQLLQKKSWQKVEVTMPAASGLVTQKFEVQFILPEKDEFKTFATEHTMVECLDKWVVNARGMQADESNAKEIEFTPEIKQQLIKTPVVSASMWESLQHALSGGRAKN